MRLRGRYLVAMAAGRGVDETPGPMTRDTKGQEIMGKFWRCHVALAIGLKPCLNWAELMGLFLVQQPGANFKARN